MFLLLFWSALVFLLQSWQQRFVVFVYACVRACVRACVCVCVRLLVRAQTFYCCKDSLVPYKYTCYSDNILQYDYLRNLLIFKSVGSTVYNTTLPRWLLLTPGGSKICKKCPIQVLSLSFYKCPIIIGYSAHYVPRWRQFLTPLCFHKARYTSSSSVLLGPSSTWCQAQYWRHSSCCPGCRVIVDLRGAQCVKDEVAVLGCPVLCKPDGYCGRPGLPCPL